ncbi:MAG: histidine ammonia-lyase [Planctomycetota bacterium]|nr:histidine ammonia-lyase [Planctomycetota bacterium]
MAARAKGPKSITVGGHLSADAALRGAVAPHPLKIGARAKRRVRASAKRIREAVAAGEWVYGVTTGFGSNADIQVDEKNAAVLQRNLLVSHAFGDGEPFDDDVVRLALLLRIHALAQGYSGVREETLAALIALYEKDVLAVVPCRGSVGASGDLAPLSFLALPLIGEGKARLGGRTYQSRTALKKAGLAPVTLSFKEGLALVNGMQITLAVALFALAEAELLVRTADVCAALTAEALAARSESFDARLHEVRRHAGQGITAAHIRKVIQGSKLIDVEHGVIPGKRRAPQDAYGVRCAPQVHGAVHDGLGFVRDTLSAEIDAVTDNPLVFDDDILAGGNFHGEPVALAADHLKLCIHELGSVSERRTATLVDRHMNEGLPSYLTPKRGLHSGFMIPQYVAAAHVSESKTLCFPASADSIPTGSNIEDHVSMGPIAARRAREVAGLVTTVLAIELMAAAQAVDLRSQRPGRRAQAVVDLVRTVVPRRVDDEPWDDALARVKALVSSGQIAKAAGV